LCCVGSVVDVEFGHPRTARLDVISHNIRAMVDKMCFVAVFGNKTVYESKVPAINRLNFEKYLVERHSTDVAREEFITAWKAWLRDHETATVQDVDPVMFDVFGLDDGDDQPPASGAAAGAAGSAAAAGGAAAAGLPGSAAAVAAAAAT